MEAAPRDELERRWTEKDEVVYQVHFWRQLNEPEPPGAPLWESDSYRLFSAEDVAEVLAWAEEHAAGRRIVVYVEVNRYSGNEGRVRLRGVDPTTVNIPD